MSRDDLRFFYWQFSEPRLSEHDVSVFAFGDNLEAAIVDAVRSCATLTGFFFPGDAASRLQLFEVAAIIEERLCTEPPRGCYATRKFVLYHLGALGRVDHEPRAVTQSSSPGTEYFLCTCGLRCMVKCGGNERLGDVECYCGRIWARGDNSEWQLRVQGST